MKKLTFFCALVALLFSSCSSVKTISYSETRSVEPTQTIFAVPLVADLQISGTRIEYSENVSVNIEEMNASEVKSFIENLKNSVLARAIKKYNADVMAAPLFEFHNEGGKCIMITLTGYPATYKNFRSANKDDSWFIHVEAPAQKGTEGIPSRKFKLFGK